MHRARRHGQLFRHPCDRVPVQAHACDLLVFGVEETEEAEGHFVAHRQQFGRREGGFKRIKIVGRKRGNANGLRGVRSLAPGRCIACLLPDPGPTLLQCGPPIPRRGDLVSEDSPVEPPFATEKLALTAVKLGFQSIS